EIHAGLPAISPDGSLLTFRLADLFRENRLPGGHAIRLKDLRDPGAATRLLTGYQARIDALAFDPEGRRLATGDRGGSVIVWDVAEGREIVRAEHLRPIRAIAFIAGGDLLVVEEKGDLVVLDAGGGRPIRRDQVGGGLTAVAVAASGDRAVIGR